MIITLQTLVFFRESLLNALDRLLRPYYNKLSLAFGRNAEASDDEEPDEQVFAEYDEERGVVFYPPMYLQRYAAVSDCLMDEHWCGKLEKVVDLGYHDMSFINYLKEVQGVKCILGVDLESIPLRCSIDLVGCEDYAPKRETPLQVTLFKGNAADPDYRLIGCDAVIAIEMIEHMLPHDLDRLIHTVFGFIKPWIAIFTTPNQDFNVLFKALEKNGLRRLDHFFEWSRDQFHDWCSNIVVRYPEYTVSCKGVGPGPNGTKHLGCCSQMALFVSKDYHKQQDLNLNSLALVSDSPSPHSISNLISSWETPEIPSESHMIEPPKNGESFFELQSEMQSSITLVLTTPSSSQYTIHYQDKTSQCNLDSETERGYLMFDDEQMCYDVLKPRRAMNNHRVYEIEDVYNRLNCTTFEVKKFSKTTLNLMAKNKLDTLVHTREVVDEIRHLTKMLNFNKDFNNQLENGTHTWYNINWGDNAPYWNQYYKIVKAYNYPFEVKSDECRILDLVSDEINRLINSQFDDDFSSEVNKLEIPIEHLMRVVQQITDDVEKVKDLLEWNGYEIRGDYVIHSRLVVDYSSVGTQEDDSPTTTDVYSDWDSASLSDGSTNVADIHARCLRRALDQKVRKLRSMLTADEDITTELDQVVCRLMKLALRTSKGRNTPPPTKWMQCKLLDLLTLTEKTIERRKRHFIESYQLKAINYEEKSQEMIALEKIKEDDTASKIVDKYKHLVNQTDDMRAQYNELDFDLVDDLSVTSSEFAKVADYEFVDRHSISPLVPERDLPCTEIFNAEDAPQDIKLQRTQAWVEEDIEVVPYPMHDGIFDVSLVDTDHISYKFTGNYNKKHKSKQCNDFNLVLRKKSHSKACKPHRIEVKSKENSRTKLGKKMSRKKSFSNGLGSQTTHSKFDSVDKTHRVKPRRKQYKNLPIYPTVAKPIPVSLIELCHPEMMVESDVEHFHTFTHSEAKADEDKVSSENKSEIAATEESMLIEIITEAANETIALRRTIGTDADTESMILEDETLIRSVSNTIHRDDVFENHISAENIHSQTIFLYDIDEPTTSKGIRHTAMDVQCGPDTTAPIYSTLSATTSLTKVPKIVTAGIKIGGSHSDMKVTSTDFGTYTDDIDNGYKTITPKSRFVGIKIKDSDSHIVVNRMEFSTASNYSTLSGTTSLARMPKTSATGITVSNSETGNRIQNSDFRVDHNTSKRDFNSYFPKEPLIGIKIKDSTSIISKQLESSTTNELFDVKQDISKVTTIFESTPFASVSKGRDKHNAVNMECSTSTQKLYDKLIVSSQQLFKRDSELLKEPYTEQEFKEFSSNSSNRTKYLRKSQDSIGKSSLSPKQMSEKQTTPKGIQKRSIRLQDSVPHIPKRRKWPTIAQKPRNKPMVSVKKTTTKHIPKEKSLPNKPNADPNPKLLSKLSNELNTNFHNICRTSPLFSKRTTLTVSRVEEVSIGLGIEDRNLILVDNKSHVSQAFSKENASLEITREMKIDDSVSEVSETIENAFTIPNYSTQNTNQEVISPTNNFLNSPRQQIAKNVKQKLSNGGVQVHSYKDQQALSEDVMFQGQWRQNKPKVLSRKKGSTPLFFKKNDLNLKKKINAVELNSTNKANSDGKNRHKNESKQELTQLLLPHNIILTHLKQKSDIKESKQNQTRPNTTCAAIVAKPFRNILKVPSNFPISVLPSNHLKSKIIVKQTENTALPANKVEITRRKELRKNYIPPYLRQKKQNSPNKITDLNSSLDAAICKIKKSKENIPKALVRSKTEELKRDLLRLQTKPPQAEYIVLRNEIEQKKSDGQQIKSTSESARRKDVSKQRSSTPASVNSSSGSSPCSISTVRAVAARKKHATSRRHSSASYINHTPTSGSENSTPERNRKFTKQCKSVRKNIENKENIPQTSKNFKVGKKDSTKLVKGVYMSQKKDVYISQVKDSIQSTANTPSKHKNQKSNLNIPIAKNFTEKKSSSRPVSPSNERSVLLVAPLSASGINDISECAQTSDMVLIIEPQARQINNSPYINVISKLDDTNVVNNCFMTKNVVNNNEEAIDSSSVQTIKSTMRALLEETLDFIDDPLVDENLIEPNMDTISNPENIAPRVDSSESATSFKTGVTSDDNNEVLLPIDIEYALNQSFDNNFDVESTLSLNDTHFTVTDLDCFSFKSMTSGSRLSGYLSADNEFSSSVKLPKCSIAPPTSTSVREIFERKDLPFQPAQNQNQTGALANQAFSGFTINEGPVAGDTPDLVNIIDSETGSLLAVANPRQAASEEVLISGRSSESFESCVLDDDSVVPNWLFQLISQQASSLDELEPPGESNPLPVVDPLFDDNGNVVEAPGAGAGAGDGHGIHSDHSRDSSGHGTSLSSSETSSGQQSEVILIDPAAFAAQFELLRDAVEDSVVLALSNPEGSDNATGSRQVPDIQELEPQPFSGGESRRNPRVVLTSASDADADISSFETDEVPDSSDN